MSGFNYPASPQFDPPVSTPGERAERVVNRALVLERLVARGAPQVIIGKQVGLIREALAEFERESS